MSCALSLVVPAFNEARRLPPAMAELARFAQGRAGLVEIVIVVEQSADGTLEIARELAAQQAHSPLLWTVLDGGPQRGKGHAVRTGVLAARGEFIFYLDADLSVPLSAVDPFLQVFAGEPSVAVLLGNRQHARSHIVRSQRWLRRTMGQIFNTILNGLGLTSCHDTQCGFKAFRREAAREIFRRQQLDGFAFDVEVLLLARQLGFRTRDLPVAWVNSPESKVRILRDSWQMLRDAWTLRRLRSAGPPPA